MNESQVIYILMLNIQRYATNGVTAAILHEVANYAQLKIKV